MIKPIPTRTPMRSRLVAGLSALAANVAKGAGMLHNVVMGGPL